LSSSTTAAAWINFDEGRVVMDVSNVNIEDKKKIILISILLNIAVFTTMNTFAQRYFACDSVVFVSGDSIVITSKCSYKIILKYFPNEYFDTLRSTNSKGSAELETGLIEYRGNTKNYKGKYRVIYNGRILEECEMYKYIPHGLYKRYARGYNIPPNICLEKIQFKNGERHGLTTIYSQKNHKKIIKEKYCKGQLIKKVERYEKW
jgi:hypothetical protein